MPASSSAWISAAQVAVRGRVGGGSQRRRQEFVLGAQRPDVDAETRGARAARQPGIARRRPAPKLHDHPLVRADGVRVARDLPQPRVAHEIQIGARVARQREVEGLARGRHELHERQIGLRVAAP